MDGHARIQQRAAAGLHRGLQAGDEVRSAGKAALVRPECGLCKAGAFVQHGQYGEAHARVLGCIGHRPRHCGLVGIGLTVFLVVQVMELTHLRVAALQQLDIKLGGHGPHLRGRDAQGRAIHAVPPGPEVVCLGLAPLREAGKGTLECVAMCIHQSR